MLVVKKGKFCESLRKKSVVDQVEEGTKWILVENTLNSLWPCVRQQAAFASERGYERRQMQGPIATHRV
jgi:hypothetical protein